MGLQLRRTRGGFPGRAPEYQGPFIILVGIESVKDLLTHPEAGPSSEGLNTEEVLRSEPRKVADPSSEGSPRTREHLWRTSWEPWNPVLFACYAESTKGLVRRSFPGFDPAAPGGTRGVACFVCEPSFPNGRSWVPAGLGKQEWRLGTGAGSRWSRNAGGPSGGVRAEQKLPGLRCLEPVCLRRPRLDHALHIQKSSQFTPGQERLFKHQLVHPPVRGRSRVNRGSP